MPGHAQEPVAMSHLSTNWLPFEGLLAPKHMGKGMHTHLFPSIPHRTENIRVDVGSADGDGTRSVVDGDFLEAAQINANPVLQLAQRYRKPMAASGSQERDAPASGDFYLVRSVSYVWCSFLGRWGVVGRGGLVVRCFGRRKR